MKLEQDMDITKKKKRSCCVTALCYFRKLKCIKRNNKSKRIKLENNSEVEAQKLFKIFSNVYTREMRNIQYCCMESVYIVL